jgi:hypothetical protein
MFNLDECQIAKSLVDDRLVPECHLLFVHHADHLHSLYLEGSTCGDRRRHPQSSRPSNRLLSNELVSREKGDCVGGSPQKRETDATISTLPPFFRTDELETVPSTPFAWNACSRLRMQEPKSNLRSTTRITSAIPPLCHSDPVDRAEIST